MGNNQAIGSIAVMADGVILGTGSGGKGDGKLYTRQTLDSDWIPAMNTKGQVSDIAVMPDGTIVGVGYTHKLYTRKTLDSDWEKTRDAGGHSTGVAVMADGTIVGLGRSNTLWIREGWNENWKKLTIDNNRKLSGVAVKPDGTILGIGMGDDEGKVFARAGRAGRWKPAANIGTGIRSLAVMKDGKILTLGTDGRLQIWGLAARAPYPIDFKLYDEGGDANLYIDDGSAAHPLNLELRNRSGRNIEWSKRKDGKASADNHHLELRFRPGILSRKSMDLLCGKTAAKDVLAGSANEWDLHASQPTNPGAPVSVYLLYKGAEKLLEADASRIVTLHKLTADADRGARPTQVELKLHQMRYEGADDAIVSTRTGHLYVFHWGRPDVPLHVGFPGNDMIRLGVAYQTLYLHVVNTSRSEPLGASLGDDPRPTFILSFEVGDENKWWALCKEDEIKAIDVEVLWPWEKHPKLVKPLGHALEEDPTKWKIVTPDGKLLPGQHIEIRIHLKELYLNKRNYSTTPTNLYVEYMNIPKYRHGRLTVPIRRAPYWDRQLYGTINMTNQNESILKQHNDKIENLRRQLDSLNTKLDELDGTTSHFEYIELHKSSSFERFSFDTAPYVNLIRIKEYRGKYDRRLPALNAAPSYILKFGGVLMLKDTTNTLGNKGSGMRLNLPSYFKNKIPTLTFRTIMYKLSDLDHFIKKGGNISPMEAEFVLEEGCYFYIKTILDKFHTLDPSPYIPKKPQFYIIFLENLFPTQYQVIASNPETYQ